MLESSDQTPKNDPHSANPADWPKPMQEAVQILRDAFIAVFQQRERAGLGQGVKAEEQ